MILTTELLILMTVAVVGTTVGIGSMRDTVNSEMQDLSTVHQGLVQRAVLTHHVHTQALRSQRQRGLTPRLYSVQTPHLLNLPGTDAIRQDDGAMDGPPALEGLPCN